MNDIDPPKKSKLAESWKSITENLFGVQFDGQENLDEIDIDSVADVVEQLNPVEETKEEQAKEEAQTPQGEPVPISEDELSFDEEETEEEAVAFEEADEPNDESEEAGQAEPVSVDAELSDQDDSVDEGRSARVTEKAFSRASFDDEDPFGFGIDDLDDDDIDDDTAESSEPTASVLKGEVGVEESLESDDAADAFDFELDEEGEADEVKASKSNSRREERGSGRTGRDKPAESPQLDEGEPEEASGKIPVRQTADDDDGFWDSLKDWDGEDSSPAREDKKRGSSRRSRERQKKVASEEADFVADETELQEEAERESRPRRAKRRRRRSARSRKNEPAIQSGSSAQEEKEIAPEDIDRLWEGDDEEVLSVPADTSSDEASLDDSERETAGEGRKRRRRRSSRSSGNRSESGERSETTAETDSESSEQKREQTQSRQVYKNIPTWVEAIEMIVRRRDSDPNKGRSRSGGSGRRGRSRGSSRKRPSRRRED